MRKQYQMLLGAFMLFALLLAGCTGNRPGETVGGSPGAQASDGSSGAQAADGSSGAQTSDGGSGAQASDGSSGAQASDGTPAGTGPSAGEEPTAEPVTFEGTDMEGNAVTSQVFSQSKLTMVNVWATYCNPCLREMPSLGELAADYDAEEFQIIGIVSDVLEGEDQTLAESLIQETGADYPHLLLNESLYYGLLTDVSAVPTTFFLDEDGVILDTVIGAMEKSAWEERINGLLETL